MTCLLILIWLAGYALSIYIVSKDSDVSLSLLVALVLLWPAPTLIWLVEKGDVAIIKRRKPRG